MKTTKKQKPLVAIIMGSDSDLPSMQKAFPFLNDFNIPFEVAIVSAHRTPDWMMKFAKSAERRGIKVIIAGAGGAAHLPGMVASLTHLPVIGVPINATLLNGLDAILSILQMPKGIPVATVALENSENAALLAVRILALNNPKLSTRIKKYQSELKKMVLKKNKNLKINE